MFKMDYKVIFVHLHLLKIMIILIHSSDNNLVPNIYSI